MKSRIAVILAVLLGAFVLAYPSWDPDSPLASLHAFRVRLHPDLAGGSVLGFRVKSDHEIALEVHRDRMFLERTLPETLGGPVDVGGRRPTSLLVQSAASEAVVRQAVQSQLNSYDYVGSADGRHEFELSQQRREEIAVRAKERTIEMYELWTCGPGWFEESYGERFFGYFPGDFPPFLQECGRPRNTRTIPPIGAAVSQR